MPSQRQTRQRHRVKHVEGVERSERSISDSVSDEVVVSSLEVKLSFRDVVRRVVIERKRVVVTHYRDDLVAIVGMDDLRRLREMDAAS